MLGQGACPGVSVLVGFVKVAPQHFVRGATCKFTMGLNTLKKR